MADSDEVSQAEFNAAFVAMQYFTGQTINVNGGWYMS